MSQDRGKRAARWVAAYLQPWWPSIEATPGGRNGADLLGCPGVAWEVKTEADWRPAGALAQAARNAPPGDLAIVFYLPPGVGADTVGTRGHIVMAPDTVMTLLVAAGYAPAPAAELSCLVTDDTADLTAWLSPGGPAPHAVPDLAANLLASLRPFRPTTESEPTE
jgi:hypothetical protein